MLVQSLGQRLPPLLPPSPPLPPLNSPLLPPPPPLSQNLLLKQFKKRPANFIQMV
jgi:hypothetical protein